MSRHRWMPVALGVLVAVVGLVAVAMVGVAATLAGGGDAVGLINAVGSTLALTVATAVGAGQAIRHSSDEPLLGAAARGAAGVTVLWVLLVISTVLNRDDDLPWWVAGGGFLGIVIGFGAGLARART